MAQPGLQLQPQLEEALERPLRAPDVELVGPMQDMAYTQPKWLICYGGAQYIQATRVLYQVLSHADGKTPVEEIARLVSAETGGDISAGDVRWLIRNRLAPSGLLVLPQGASPDGSQNSPQAAIEDAAPDTVSGAGIPAGRVSPPEAPVLGIRHRLPLLSYRVTAPLTAVLKQLYWPPLMVAVVAAAVAINVWLYRGADLVQSLRTLLLQPEVVLVLFVLDKVLGLWHELGHASALRRAGARYGNIGFALYAIFPVFYTDVTHSYRLNRRQRIRVDLGGIYFDLISMTVLFAVYRFAGYYPLLLMIVLKGFLILQEFTPFVRFDGYYLIADAIGVPEPLSLLGAFIQDHLPRRRRRPKMLPPLRPLAQVILTSYLIAVVAFLLRPGLVMAVAGGQILALLPQSAIVRWSYFVDAWRSHSVLLAITGTLQLMLWTLIPLGLALFFFSLIRLFGRIVLALVRRWRRPGRAQTMTARAAARQKQRRPVSGQTRVLGWNWRWPGTIAPALIIGLGAAAAAGVISSQLASYEATATISLQAGDTIESKPSGSSEKAIDRLSGLTSLALVGKVVHDLQIRDDPADVLRGITVSPRPGSQAVSVKVKHRDPSNAAAIANRLVDDYVAERQAQQQILTASLRGLQTSITELANRVTENDKAISSLEALPPRSLSAAQRAQLNGLQQKRAADSATYTALVKSYEDIRANQLASFSAVAIIEPAGVPAKPIFPNKELNMLLAGALGMALATGLMRLAGRRKMLAVA